MFWRRKKNSDNDPVYGVQNFAAQLGIERRRNTRILCPSEDLTSLPSVFFGARRLQVHDISVGGLCLKDADNILGPEAGIELELRLMWPGLERMVRSRLVSRVDVRRHVQFLNLDEERAEYIKRSIAPGILGQTMKPVLAGTQSSVKVQAREIWSSIKGDCLTFSASSQDYVELTLSGKTFRILQSSWPVTALGTPAETIEVEEILLFLFNCPRPSPALLDLQAQLRASLVKGRK